MADNLRGGGSDAATAGGEAVSIEVLDEDMMRGDVEIVHDSAAPLPRVDEEMPTAVSSGPRPWRAMPPTLFGPMRVVHTGGVGGQVWIENGSIIFAKWSTTRRTADEQWYVLTAGPNPEDWRPVPEDWFQP